MGVEGATGDIWLFGIKETKVLHKMSTSPLCSKIPDRCRIYLLFKAQMEFFCSHIVVVEFHTGVSVLLEPCWNLNATVISFNILQKLILLVTIRGQ